MQTYQSPPLARVTSSVFGDIFSSFSKPQSKFVDPRLFSTSASPPPGTVNPVRSAYARWTD